MLPHLAVQTWAATTVQVSQQVTHENMGNVQNNIEPNNEKGLNLQEQIEAFHDKKLC